MWSISVPWIHLHESGVEFLNRFLSQRQNAHSITSGNNSMDYDVSMMCGHMGSSWNTISMCACSSKKSVASLVCRPLCRHRVGGGTHIRQVLSNRLFVLMAQQKKITRKHRALWSSLEIAGNTPHWQTMQQAVQPSLQIAIIVALLAFWAPFTRRLEFWRDTVHWACNLVCSVSADNRVVSVQFRWCVLSKHVQLLHRHSLLPHQVCTSWCVDSRSHQCTHLSPLVGSHAIGQAHQRATNMSEAKFNQAFTRLHPPSRPNISLEQCNKVLYVTVAEKSNKYSYFPHSTERKLLKTYPVALKILQVQWCHKWSPILGNFRSTKKNIWALWSSPKAKFEAANSRNWEQFGATNIVFKAQVKHKEKLQYCIV